jgi:hypothetical protein
MVFERQGEGSREVNGLPDVCPRPFVRNQHRVHATTWHASKFAPTEARTLYSKIL